MEKIYYAIVKPIEVVTEYGTVTMDQQVIVDSPEVVELEFYHTLMVCSSVTGSCLPLVTTEEFTGH